MYLFVLTRLKAENHWILINFDNELRLNALILQFQGGFAANNLNVYYFTNQKLLRKSNYALQDTSGEQRIVLTDAPECDQIKLELNECSDMFGRLIVYKLALD